MRFSASTASLGLIETSAKLKKSASNNRTIRAKAITRASCHRSAGARQREDPDRIIADHSGFSVHNQVRVGEGDVEGRRKLAGYMLRAPMALEKMAYDAGTHTVIYRSKVHLGLKPDFQMMPGAEWLELLLRHVPDCYEHLVRYVGWYSNRSRGERAKARNDWDAPNPCAASSETVSEFAQRGKATWARLIRKVYEADPLQCPKCKGPMRVIALIEDPGVIRHILEHLALWAPEASGPGPPVPAPEWPANAVIPLTYHPVPDIA
jgi:hypothetical protein